MVKKHSIQDQIDDLLTRNTYQYALSALPRLVLASRHRRILQFQMGLLRGFESSKDSLSAPATAVRFFVRVLGLDNSFSVPLIGLYHRRRYGS